MTRTVQSSVNGALADSGSEKSAELVDPTTGGVTGRSPRPTPQRPSALLWLADALVDARTDAPHHQHLRVARLDAHLDGPENAVQMRESVSVPLGLDSPYGTAGAQHAELRRTEAGGGQDYARESQRGWRVTNPSARNDLGTSVAYRRPVMSAGVVSFWPKPSGSFDRNPASDVLPPTDHCTTTGGQQGRQR